MSEECNHDCANCGEQCDNPIEKVKPTKDSKIKKRTYLRRLFM